MKKLFKRKTIAVPSLAICMLAIIASISTSMSYSDYIDNSNNSYASSNTIEPVSETEVIKIAVDADKLKQPLAITDEETVNTLGNKEIEIYDMTWIEESSDPSINIDGGVLLETGGAYVELNES